MTSYGGSQRKTYQTTTLLHATNLLPVEPRRVHDIESADRQNGVREDVQCQLATPKSNLWDPLRHASATETHGAVLILTDIETASYPGNRPVLSK